MVRTALSLVRSSAVVVFVARLGFGSALHADEVRPNLDRNEVRMAIERAVPLLETASAGSASQRQCFTCHSQAIPVLALSKALELGFDVDTENLTQQVSHTYAHLERGRQKYADGEGQGGRVVTAGYALWTLEAGGRQPDEVTAAVTEFLLKHQADQDHWHQSSRRPPTSGSPFMTSYVAIRGLTSFGTAEQLDGIEQRRSSVRSWLDTTEPLDTEDRVFQLRLLSLLQPDHERTDQALKELLARQRSDGGWSQQPDTESDAYATGTVLAAVLDLDLQSADSGATWRAVGWLLQNQLPDGSWLVQTRADGFQEYFETGFPHEEHQFISTSASAWSTLALLSFLEGSSHEPR